MAQMTNINTSAATATSSVGTQQFASLMMQSVKAHGIPTHEMNLPKAMLGARRSVYLAALEVFNRQCPDTAVVLTDSADAFVRCNATELRRRVVHRTQRVIISAERSFSFQGRQIQAWYDARAADYALVSNRTPSLYRYPNVGGIAGRVRDVLLFMRLANATEGPRPDMSWFTPWHDQAPISEAIYNHGQKLAVGLDYDSEIFYVATGHEDANGEAATASRRIASSDPCFIHVPGTRDRGNKKTLNRLTARYNKNSTRRMGPEDLALLRLETEAAALLSADAAADELATAAAVIARDRREKFLRGARATP